MRRLAGKAASKAREPAYMVLCFLAGGAGMRQEGG